MFSPGDAVTVRHRDENTEYPQVHTHELHDAVSVWYHRGIICDPKPDTPEGHHVVRFGFFLSFKMLTIPFEDLMLDPQQGRT